MTVFDDRNLYLIEVGVGVALTAVCLVCTARERHWPRWVYFGLSVFSGFLAALGVWGAVNGEHTVTETELTGSRVLFKLFLSLTLVVAVFHRNHRTNGGGP